MSRKRSVRNLLQGPAIRPDVNIVHDEITNPERSGLMHFVPMGMHRVWDWNPPAEALSEIEHLFANTEEVETPPSTPHHTVSGTGALTLSPEAVAEIESLFGTGSPQVGQSINRVRSRENSAWHMNLDGVTLSGGSRSGRVSHAEPNWREVPRREVDQRSGTTPATIGRIVLDPVTWQRRYVTQ